MSIQEMRTQWEDDVRRTRRRAWIAGAAAALIVIVAALVGRLSPSAALRSVLLGGLAWALGASAFEALLERTRRGPAHPALSGPGRGETGLLVVLGALTLLALWGVLRVPGIWPPLLLGAASWAAVRQALRAREIARPRRFIEVRSDGRVLTAPVGGNLLEALEGAGYRLMTPCGRAGRCAACRVRVRMREGAPQWSEKQLGPYLTPKQRQEGWVLSCQVPLEDDLVVELFKPLVIRWPAFDRSRMSDAARRLRRALPGFDCEVCGHPTCDEYAQACAEGRDPLDRCLPGGEPVRGRLEALAEGSGAHAAPAPAPALTR